MKKVWKHGAGKKFAQFIKEATGSELSDGAWTREHTQGIAETLKEAAKFNTQNEYKARTKKIDLDATIILTDGKNIIADSKKGFDAMARTYTEWLNARE